MLRDFSLVFCAKEKKHFIAASLQVLLKARHLESRVDVSKRVNPRWPVDACGVSSCGVESRHT